MALSFGLTLLPYCNYADKACNGFLVMALLLTFGQTTGSTSYNTLYLFSWAITTPCLYQYCLYLSFPWPLGFTSIYFELLTSILQSILNVHIPSYTPFPDSFAWALTKNETFTTKSLYHHLLPTNPRQSFTWI